MLSLITIISLSRFFSSLMAQFAWNHITFLYHQNPAKSGKGGTTCEFTMAMAWRSKLILEC